MRKLAILMALMLPVARPGSAQVPLKDVELLEGPWEYSNPVGVDGIFITVQTTLVSRRTTAPAIEWQTVSICVYHRGTGQSDDAKCFSPPPYRSSDQVPEQDYSTDLKNRHLAIHYGLDLELAFEEDARQWVGTWSERGKSRKVILERPRSVSTQNPFVGDWESNPEATARSHATGRLHIRESSDGVLTAWLDRQSPSSVDPRSQTTQSDVRNGELLKIVADQRKLTLTTTNSFGVPYHYSGTLSSEGENLAGEWQTERSGRLSAPDNYVRQR